MKNLMISTAIMAFTALSANAQTESPFRAEAVAGEVYASDFIGMRVYASEGDIAGTGVSGVQSGWDDIGEINDVILSRDGKIDAVLVDIGGFLGVGERQVAVNMNAIRFVSEDGTAEDPNDFFLVMSAADAMVKEAPEYMRAPHSATRMSETKEMPLTTTAPADTTIVPADNMIARDGYAVAEREALTAEKLTGARVYDATDADIGEVSKLILGSDGQITEAVIDVGGFLGLGEKPVALPLTDITILRETDGDDIRVYVSQTKEQLEAMPDYQM